MPSIVANSPDALYYQKILDCLEPDDATCLQKINIIFNRVTHALKTMFSDLIMCRWNFKWITNKVAYKVVFNYFKTHRASAQTISPYVIEIIKTCKNSWQQDQLHLRIQGPVIIEKQVRSWSGRGDSPGEDLRVQTLQLKFNFITSDILTRIQHAKENPQNNEMESQVLRQEVIAIREKFVTEQKGTCAEYLKRSPSELTVGAIISFELYLYKIIDSYNEAFPWTPVSFEGFCLHKAEFRLKDADSFSNGTRELPSDLKAYSRPGDSYSSYPRYRFKRVGEHRVAPVCVLENNPWGITLDYLEKIGYIEKST